MKQHRSRTLEEGFWRKVVKAQGCWKWVGAKSPFGYGVIGREGRTYRAHRISWQLHNGAIPAGKHVLHRCDVAECTNPQHLFLGDHYINMKDMGKKGRQWLQKNSAGVRGEKHPRTKFTEAIVRYIRTKYAAGSITQRELATEFKVSRPTITAVIAGRNWGHVK